MLVGDNRDRSNVGCRATSIALSDVLRPVIDVDSVISGGTIERPMIGLSLLDRSAFRGVAKKATRSQRRWDYSAKVPRQLRLDVGMAAPEKVAADIIDQARRSKWVAQFVDQIASADAVVLNGEGDLIFTRPPRRKLVFLLAVLHIAGHFGRPTAYVNAMVSDPPDGVRNPEVVEWARAALRSCSLVTVRDRESLALARELGLHDDPQWVPDALFTWSDRQLHTWDLDPSIAQGVPLEGRGATIPRGRPYVCLSGSSAFGAGGMAPPIEGFERIIEGLSAMDVQPVLVECGAAEEYLRPVANRCGVPLVPWSTNIFVLAGVLSRAAAYVSGRHHPTILGALGGTPPIMIGSNSHKNRSLLELLQVDDPSESPPGLSSAGVDALLERVREALRAGDASDEARSALRARCVELGGLSHGLAEAVQSSFAEQPVRGAGR